MLITEQIKGPMARMNPWLKLAVFGKFHELDTMESPWLAMELMEHSYFGSGNITQTILAFSMEEKQRRRRYKQVYSVGRV